MRYLLYALFLILPLPLTAQMIYTVGGNGSEYYDGDGGPATAAQIAEPVDVTISKKGNIYIADNLNHVIRKINPSGIITTIAGNHIMGYSGDGGPATTASIKFPEAVAVDTSENVYLADRNNVIRKINKFGVISTVAGGGLSLGDSGPATNAYLYNPVGVAVDKAGNIYISDGGNARIRKVTTSGMISTIAGTGVSGYTGDGGPATAAKIQAPTNLKFDTSGNLYFAAYGNMAIRRISQAGIITTVAGTGYSISPGFGGYSGDGGPATDARLSGPSGVALDKFGNLYISDYLNNVIRMVNPSGIINTIAGNGFVGYDGSGIPVATTPLGGPLGMEVDSNGVLYFADIANNRIRKIIMNCLPSLITGSDKVCVGSSVTLNDSLSGGVWSSSNSTATITSSGVMVGISPGVDTIKYTLNNVCGVNSSLLNVSVEVPLTVAPITGIDSVCIGSYVILADATPGGHWSLSNTNASVGVTGKVTGIASGYDSLIYTVTNSCGVYNKSRNIKVNSLPDIGDITGPDSVCAGSTINLNDTTSGGVWNVSNTLAFIISGNLTGITSGIDTVAYTVTRVCTAKSTKEIRILPQPYAGQIYGDIQICPDDSTQLIDTVSNGVWNRSNSNATVINGLVKGISSGLDTISYSVTNSCNTAIAKVVVTIDPLPDAGTITGADELCIGSSVMLTFSASSGIWSLTNSNASVANGILSGIKAGNDTVIYLVSNSCGKAATSFAFTVNTFPEAGTITSPSSFCVDSNFVIVDSISGGIWHTATGNAVISDVGLLTANSVGIDTIIYTVSNSCGSASAQMEVNIINCDSLLQVGPKSILMYPDPVNDKLTIACNFNINSIVINNMLGQLVANYKYNSHKVDIEVGDFSCGVYTVRINGKEIKKFVKR